MTEEEYNVRNARLDKLERLIISSNKEILTTGECALLTGYSEAQQARMRIRREIPYYKPNGGKVFYKRSEIESWLLRNRKDTEEEINQKATTYYVTHKRM